MLLLAVFYAGSAMSETLYVNDYLRVGIRASPNSSDIPVAVVTTGDGLEVLEEQDGYIRVRAESGVEGWVSRSYVSNEMPARLLLDKAQKESALLREETKTLQNQLAEKTQYGAEVDKKVAELLDENSKLHQQVSQYYSANARSKKTYTWIYQFLGIAALFALGVYLGVRWERRRVAERLGGLEL